MEEFYSTGVGVHLKMASAEIKNNKKVEFIAFKSIADIIITAN